MEAVRKGYKRTEVGIIPEDWEAKVIGDVVDFVGGSQPPRSTFIFTLKDGYIRLIQIRDYKTDKYATYIPESLANKKCTADDIMIGRYGPPIFQILRGIEGAYNVALLKVIHTAEVEHEYLYHFLKQENLFRFVELLSRRSSGQTGVEIPALKNYPFPLPPLKEQEAIAAALSEVDDEIAALDALIAKKRDAKQGAMQDLLTGKERLAGFSGEWEVLNMGKHSILKARIGWQGLTTAEYLETGDYYLVTGTDFVDGKIEWRMCHFVDKHRYDQDKYIQLRLGDVLVTKDGTIGKVAYIDFLPAEATLNSGVFVIRPKNGEFDPLFLYYILSSTIFRTFLSQLQAGSTINHLYQKDFVSFEFYAPSIDEQRLIASILYGMDEEITMLETQREKTVALKQGMMQELLTGKTRLV